MRGIHSEPKAITPSEHVSAPHITPPRPSDPHHIPDSGPQRATLALPKDLVSKKLDFGAKAEGGPRYLKLEPDGSVSITSDRKQKTSRAEIAKALQEKVQSGNLTVTEMFNLYKNADALIAKRSLIQRIIDGLGLSDRMPNISGLKRSIEREVQERPSRTLSQLRSVLGKDVDIPSTWRKTIADILGKNQQLIDPLVEATKGDPHSFSNAIFDASRHLSSSEFRTLNGLNAVLQEKFIGLTNRQFHTDSIPTLMFKRGDEGTSINRTDRFYEGLDQFQQALKGEQTSLYSDMDEATRSRLKDQTAAATSLAQRSGLGEVQWSPGGRDAGFMTTHAGWTPESLPSDDKPAVVKATRTLGLMLGDTSRVASVPLDLSSMGSLSVAQAKAALNLVQSAAVDVANQKPVKGFEESPMSTTGEPLFTPEQLQALKEEATRFATQSQQLINTLHQQVTKPGLPPVTT